MPLDAQPLMLQSHATIPSRIVIPLIFRSGLSFFVCPNLLDPFALEVTWLLEHPEETTSTYIANLPVGNVQIVNDSLPEPAHLDELSELVLTVW